MGICFVSQLTGRHPGGVTSQAEILYDLFRKEAGEFYATSAKRNRYHRMLDMSWCLVRNRRRIKLQCISVYSGPSFVVADFISSLGRALGHKIILHLHGGGLPQLFVKKPQWAKRVLKRGDAIVAPSLFLARATESLGLKSLVIPNVICLEDYDYRERAQIQPKLFWMRSFHPFYNPEMAVQVLASLRCKGIPATLVMGGTDKGSLAPTRQLAEELRVAEYVDFPGFLTAAEKRIRGNAAEIFLNTNRVDNMPVAVVEACAMGLPVVATSVGGIPDLLRDGNTGLLVPNEDAEAMAGAVCRLLHSPELTVHLSRNGRQLAEGSAWPAVRRDWQGLFNQLSGRP